MAKRKKRRTIFREILIIMTVVFAFMTSACVNKREMVSEHFLAFVVTAAADAFILGAWFLIAVRALMRRKRRKRSFGKQLIRNRGVLIALLYCFCTRIVQFADTPRWDGLIYYRELAKACLNFDFTIQSFVRGFALASHPTLGFAGIAGIGEFWDSCGYTGALMTQLVLNLLMAYCLYRIIEKMLPRCLWVYHTIGTCILLSVPLVLGTFSYFQPDNGTVYFFVFVVYCYLFKRNVLMFFSMILLILSKEVGVLALAGFGIGAFLGYLLFEGEEESVGKRFAAFFRQPLGIAGILAVICLFGYFFYTLKNGGTIWRVENENIEGFSTFSFQPRYVVFRWKQIFVMHFNWLICGLGVAAGFFMLINSWSGKRFSKRLARKDILLSFVMAQIVLTAFFCIYVTYALPRYLVLICFSTVFFSVIMLGACVRECEMKYVAAFSLCLLLLVETNVTVDPVSLAVFETQDTGKGPVIVEQPESSVQGEFSVSNHQPYYLNHVLYHVLKDVDYHEGMDVLVWDKVDDYDISANSVYWDPEKQERAILPADGLITVRTITRPQLEAGEVEPNDEAVFIVVPQFGISTEFAEEYMEGHYEIRYKGVVEMPFGGEVTFLVGDLRKAVQE